MAPAQTADPAVRDPSIQAGPLATSQPWVDVAALHQAADAAAYGFSVVIPAMNEELAIGDVVRRVRETMDATGLPYEVLVVDDGSTDRTAAEAARAGARVLRHPTNAGYGAALHTGITAAQHRHVVITDADGTYPTDRLPDLIAWCDRFDMVVGARTGSEYRGSLLKWCGRLILGKLCEFVTGTRIPDVNSGLRVFRRDAALRFSDTLCRGMSFTTTITLAMLSNGYFVKYVPIDYHKRVGRSKVRHLRDALRTTQIILQAITYYNPIKLFLVLAGVAGLLGVALVAAYLLSGNVVAGFGAVGCLLSTLYFFAFGMIADLLRHQKGTT